jgi:hypothetical protein
MTEPIPKIDQRSYDEIVQQTVQLVEGNTAWKQGEEGKSDAGLVLIRIFARMVFLVSDRLNQVPEKNFLAFLNLIGAKLVPPQPARVPITFYLSEGSASGAIVPAQTQIAAPSADGEEDEVVFETEQELVVTPARLEAICVKDVENQKWSDRTQSATTPNGESFPAFTAEQAIETSIYYAFDDVFSIPETKTLLLETTQKANNQPDPQETSEIEAADWQYWDGETWKTLVSDTNQREKKVSKDLVIQACKINEHSSKWLKAKLSQERTLSAFPKSISAKITYSKARPDLCFYNSIPIDFNKKFYLFGEQSILNDVVYIALGKLPKKGLLTLYLQPKDGEGSFLAFLPDLEWHVSRNKDNWQKVTIEESKDSSDKITYKVSRLELTSLEESIINGESSIWLRATVNSASDYFPKNNLYTVLKESISSLTVNRNQLIVHSARGFSSGDSIRIKFGNQEEDLEIESISIDNRANKFTLKQPLKNNYPEGAVILLDQNTHVSPLFSELTVKYEIDSYSLDTESDDNHDKYYYCNFQYQINFSNTTSEEQGLSGLYLGFDRSFDNQSISLFFETEAPKLLEIPVVSSLVEDIRSAQFVWEYAASSQPNANQAQSIQWKEFGVRDGTANFSESGTVQFIVPNDFNKASEFGKELYWLRVRTQGSQTYNPQLRRILTNTTWASQTLSHIDEVLGSGNGEPGQTMRTSQNPVLSGQYLEVNEGKLPSSNELKQLEAEHAITTIYDDTGQLEAIWICWQEVSNFYQSKPRDRHYLFDRQTGMVQFGNGKRGMPPPIGRNNIRMAKYQTGGGVRGNRAVQTVSQLKTTIPYVDRAANGSEAAGGSNQESIDRLKERAPKQLRHRNRAVTTEDFEDLAFEASAQVARAKAIPPITDYLFSPLDDGNWIEASNSNVMSASDSERHQTIATQAGRVTVIVLLQSSSSKPDPNWGFLNQIKTYLQARCAATVDLQVVGPLWQPVNLAVEVVPVDLSQSDRVRLAVSDRLHQFLHPLTGGFEQTGWEFGRYPSLSSLYRLIEGIEGVDHVRSLSFDSSTKLTSRHLIYSGQHIITCVSASRSQSFR